MQLHALTLALGDILTGVCVLEGGLVDAVAYSQALPRLSFIRRCWCCYMLEQALLKLCCKAALATAVLVGFQWFTSWRRLFAGAVGCMSALAVGCNLNSAGNTAICVVASHMTVSRHRVSLLLAVQCQWFAYVRSNAVKP